VLFSGYRVPHPLEPAIQCKVQTRSDNPGPTQAVTRALDSLSHELSVFADRFKDNGRKKYPERFNVPSMR
jgi:DNA-directed RNA polymerase II subunit RPB11